LVEWVLLPASIKGLHIVTHELRIKPGGSKPCVTMLAAYKDDVRANPTLKTSKHS